MNQRIAVRAFVKKDGKILLLRRADGRPSILGKYELVGGRVEYGEQPEEAVTRHLTESVAITAQAVQLLDAFTYVDHDNRDIQYAVIVYVISLSASQHTIHLGSNYDQYIWRKASSVHHEDVTDLSWMLLSALDGRTDPRQEKDSVSGDYGSGQLIIYTDGGSRGNPGPSAAGYAVMNDGIVVDEGGIYLGITTNNQAEYHGIRIGLEKAASLGAKSVELRIDSLLAVNQLNGTYVIKNRELWPIHERIRSLTLQFERVVFRHVKREYNQRADAMVNKILDEHMNPQV